MLQTSLNFISKLKNIAKHSPFIGPAVHQKRQFWKSVNFPKQDFDDIEDIDNHKIVAIFNAFEIASTFFASQLQLAEETECSIGGIEQYNIFATSIFDALVHTVFFQIFQMLCSFTWTISFHHHLPKVPFPHGVTKAMLTTLLQPTWPTQHLSNEVNWSKSGAYLA